MERKNQDNHNNLGKNKVRRRIIRITRKKNGGKKQWNKKILIEKIYKSMDNWNTSRLNIPNIDSDLRNIPIKI